MASYRRFVRGDVRRVRGGGARRARGGGARRTGGRTGTWRTTGGILTLGTTTTLTGGRTRNKNRLTNSRSGVWEFGK